MLDPRRIGEEPVEQGGATLLDHLEALGRDLAATRAELSRLSLDDMASQIIPAATDELGAIVAQTEGAAESILEGCETLDRLGELMAAGGGASMHDSARTLFAATTRIYAACGFQDLTGQRVARVVASLKAIEARMSALTVALGGRPSGPTDMRTYERVAVRAAGRAAGRAAERAGGRAAERAGGRAAERAGGRAAEQAAERSAERAGGRPAEQAAERSAERAGGRAAEQAAERSAERAGGRPAEQGDEMVPSAGVVTDGPQMPEVVTDRPQMPDVAMTQLDVDRLMRGPA